VNSTLRRFLLVATLAASVLALAGPASASANCLILNLFCTPAPPAAPPAPLPRFFTPDGVWNKPLATNAPLSSSSDQLVGVLRTAVTQSGTWINTTSYSVPVYQVAANQATSKVRLRSTGPADLQAAFNAVPLPNGVRAGGGTDALLTIYQPATDTMWEFWQISWTSWGGWMASWGGKMTGVMQNTGIFPAPYGASASSLPLVGGLMTIAELQAGTISHAVAFAIPHPAAGTFVYPAQRTDGDGPANGIPMGMRFRLPASLDIDALHLQPMGAMIAKAVQRYGMILHESGGAVAFFGEDSGQWTSRGLPNPYTALQGGQSPSQVLAGFPWDKLQAVAPPS
jgi:hypothetical protein